MSLKWGAWLRCNPRVDPPRFSAFDDPDGFNGSAPSAQYLRDVYAAYQAHRRPSLIKRLMMIEGKVLKGDHTFKIVKKMVADRGTVFPLFINPTAANIPVHIPSPDNNAHHTVIRCCYKCNTICVQESNSKQCGLL